jgi:hypothetical protein
MAISTQDATLRLQIMMYKNYQFKNNFKGDQITCLKPQMSNLLAVKLSLHGAHHGVVVRTRKCASYISIFCS